MFDLRNKNIYVGNQGIDRVYLGEELLKSSESLIYLAQDSDFNVGSHHVYIGSALKVDITEYITVKGLTSIGYMFSGQYSYARPVTRVMLGENDVSDMSYMFRQTQATTLDVSSFDTSKATNMNGMFMDSQATTLDLSNFDTSRVTAMASMFVGSQATTLDVSSFDTSRVRNMYSMFKDTQATTLDLSSFDTSSTNMNDMFQNSQATIGYARTQLDANRLNATRNKPAQLTFVVHPDLL